MRKTKLNFLTKLLLVSVSLLFYGCLNEDVVDKIEKQYKYNVEIVSIDKVMHLNQNIQNFNQRKNARSSTNDSIDLDLNRILVLTNNETNYTSYSIVINQQNSNILFENFHVTQNLDGTQEEFIFQWVPENLSIPFELQNYSGIVNKLDTNYNLIFSNEYINGVLQNPYNNQSNKSNPDYDTPDYQYYCETVIDCSSNECNCYDSYPCTISTVCYLGGGGSGNGSGNGFGDGLGGDGGGGGSSGGSSDNNDGSIGDNGDPLHPVVPLPEMEEEITPCGKLKNLFKKPRPDIKSTIINDLRRNINVNPNGEKAAYLQKLPNGTMGTTVSTPTTIGQIGIRTGNNYYCAIHTHPKNRQPMFSWSDIYTLYKMNLNLEQHNAGLASFLLVCEDDNGDFQTYAISFDSIGTSIENVLNNPQYAGLEHKDIIKKMDRKLYEEYSKEENSGFAPNYEKAFLKFMQNSNISLYKANNTLTNWSKLSLNGLDSNTVSPTPCN